MSDAIHVCVADDLLINRRLMAHKLRQLHPNWTVHFCDTAEQVLGEWEKMKLLIIDNDFGAGGLNGSQAIQLIRLQDDGQDLVIALWSAECVQDDPDATFMWEKTVSSETMANDLCPLLAGEHLTGAKAVATNR